MEGASSAEAPFVVGMNVSQWRMVGGIESGECTVIPINHHQAASTSDHVSPSPLKSTGGRSSTLGRSHTIVS